MNTPNPFDPIARGAVNVVPMVCAVAPLAEGAQWFERLYQKEAGPQKVILAPCFLTADETEGQK